MLSRLAYAGLLLALVVPGAALAQPGPFFDGPNYDGPSLRLPDPTIFDLPPNTIDVGLRDAEIIPLLGLHSHLSDQDLGRAIAIVLGCDLPADLTLLQDRIVALPNGVGRAVRYAETFNGVPVWGHEVVAWREPNDMVHSIHGTIVCDIDAASTPSVRPGVDTAEAIRDAADRARVDFADPAVILAPFENEEAELLYFQLPDGQLALTYRVSFFTSFLNRFGVTQPARPVLFLDAYSGTLLGFYDNLQTEEVLGYGGSGRSLNFFWGDSGVPYLVASAVGSSCDLEGDNILTETLEAGELFRQTPVAYSAACSEYFPDAAVNDAHGFGQAALDMYMKWDIYADWPHLNPMGRKLHGITDKLHLRTYRDNGSAFWDGARVNLGVGSDSDASQILLDTVAHEVAHGFTAGNSGLVYRGQSGGINEAFSDIAGETAEHFFVSKYGTSWTYRDRPDWVAGGDRDPFVTRPIPRPLCEPTSVEGGPIGHVDAYRSGLDVHRSSGVFSKAFCVLSLDYWDIQKSFAVFVLANQAFWTPFTGFTSGAVGVLRAAEVLGYGFDGVIGAFDEVGIVLTEPTPGGLSIGYFGDLDFYQLPGLDRGAIPVSDAMQCASMCLGMVGPGGRPVCLAFTYNRATDPSRINCFLKDSRGYPTGYRGAIGGLVVYTETIVDLREANAVEVRDFDVWPNTLLVYPGGLIDPDRTVDGDVPNAQACQAICGNNAQCKSFVFEPAGGLCTGSGFVPSERQTASGVTSGTVRPTTSVVPVAINELPAVRP